MNCRRPKCRGRGADKRRGLCTVCWCIPIFREKYAAPSKVAKRPDDGPTTHMTAAELDAFVAENQPTMPAGVNLDGPRTPVGKAGLFRRA